MYSKPNQPTSSYRNVHVSMILILKTHLFPGEACRLQHKKCDKKDPVCSRCKRLNKDCVYHTRKNWYTIERLVDEIFEKGVRKKTVSNRAQRMIQKYIKELEVPAKTNNKVIAENNCK